MSFRKQTVISGNTNKGFKCLIMSGHWNIKSAINRARLSQINNMISIKHDVSDMSGHGRGGHDGRYTVNKDDIYCLQSDWSEFGLEH